MQELSVKVPRFLHKQVIETHRFISWLYRISKMYKKNDFFTDKFLPTLIYREIKKFKLEVWDTSLKKYNSYERRFKTHTARSMLYWVYMYW